ncbi:MAG: nucleoside triphosphate pyrophosphohydrolase [Actinobacteria bacterium]|nr:nucleoside triphosphate pyrophosphohydrolase [Actinomycetota bacterium]
MSENHEAFSRLVEVMARLRGPGGCPWDRKQTHRSLSRYILEEAYETIDAIDSSDFDHVKEELGDLLLQIIFQAQIAAEEGKFTIDDVANGIADKLVRRHPHVFGERRTVTTPEEVVVGWEEIKLGEKGAPAYVLDGIPRSLPSLLYAYELQSKAAAVGFDWEEAESALDKLPEEAIELKNAIQTGADVEDEIGDVLFTAVNVARKLGLDPEVALRHACEKFARRFRYVEERAIQQGWSLQDMSLDELDALWDEAKEKEEDR